PELAAVAIAVEGDRVAGRRELRRQRGPAADLLAAEEERGRRAGPGERVEHGGRAGRMGTVVEGERDARGGSPLLPEVARDAERPRGPGAHRGERRGRVGGPEKQGEPCRRAQAQLAGTTRLEAATARNPLRSRPRRRAASALPVARSSSTISPGWRRGGAEPGPSSTAPRVAMPPAARARRYWLTLMPSSGR